MSRVAAILIVTCCILAGCAEKPQPIKTAAPVEIKSRIHQKDIYIVTDPNGLAAIEDLIEIEPQLQNNFFILQVKPESGADYKIIAVKPNPNIDYKILNPMQNHDKKLKELLKQKYKDGRNIPQADVFTVPQPDTKP